MSKKGGKLTFLNTHEEEVIQMVEKKKLAPKQIADSLITKYSLNPDSVTPKQVSDFIRYRKKQGKIKTPSVTGPTIRAEYSDNCFSLYELIIRARTSRSSC